jgi:hypothetical protein
MYKLNVYVDDNQVIHICPKNAMEMIWAKYWLQELAKHGMALIDVQATTDMYKSIKAES